MLQGINVALLEKVHTIMNIQSSFQRVVENSLINSMDMDSQGCEGTLHTQQI